MISEAIRHELAEARPTVLTWSLGLGLLAVFTGALFPTVGTGEGLHASWAHLPEIARAFFAGGAQDPGTLEGYLNSQLFALLPLVLAIFTISRGAALLGEGEGHGSLELTLAQPISRIGLITGHLTAMALATGIIGLAVGLSLALGLGLVGVQVPMGGVLLWALVATLPAMVFGAIALLAAVTFQARHAAVLTGAALAVGAHVVNGLGPLVPGMAALRPFSPLYHYTLSQPLVTGVQPTAILLLISTTLLVSIAAAGVFHRRDLPL
ncbi:MAG: ABC transporter permease subunit [Candidatus Thermoplasmatota archaeon]|nr:ABC transporter permease subunit [Candidatus Thermoplasmatota archaeon]